MQSQAMLVFPFSSYPVQQKLRYLWHHDFIRSRLSRERCKGASKSKTYWGIPELLRCDTNLWDICNVFGVQIRNHFLIEFLQHFSAIKEICDPCRTGYSMEYDYEALCFSFFPLAPWTHYLIIKD